MSTVREAIRARTGVDLAGPTTAAERFRVAYPALMEAKKRIAIERALESGDSRLTDHLRLSWGADFDRRWHDLARRPLRERAERLADELPYAILLT